ncbi:hypothetical protein NDU88_005841 [Pleurodeles waltl]|uniref:Uncharacterized protein n=1 Tax=Pleurodeles waltl TaxID=8319 RepID=A0AAV7TWI0_PLEWA|nr:hypothetical protein NDU88_005841 [Pleurodeles waltl]
MTCLRHGRKAGGYWAAQNGRSRRSQSCGDRSISALGVARSPSEEISALSTGLPKHQQCKTFAKLDPELLKYLKGILEEVAAYYSNVYTSEASPTDGNKGLFMSKLPVPQLTDDLKDEIDVEINDEEIREAL